MDPGRLVGLVGLADLDLHCCLRPCRHCHRLHLHRCLRLHCCRLHRWRLLRAESPGGAAVERLGREPTWVAERAVPVGLVVGGWGAAGKCADHSAQLLRTAGMLADHSRSQTAALEVELAEPRHLGEVAAGPWAPHSLHSLE